MQKQISIVGTGMNGTGMTKEGRQAVEQAQFLLGARRVVEPFATGGKPVFLSYDSQALAAQIAQSPYRNMAVLLSGDCGFYSGARGLIPLLQGCKVQVFCGISSPAYLCSKLLIPWQDLHFVSLHGTGGSILRPVCTHERTFFLLGGGSTPATVCARLAEYGLGDLPVAVGENLGCPDETITRAPAKEVAAHTFSPLSVLLVENPHYQPHIPSCIPDSRFIRGKVPMTKAEVRCVSVASLSVGTGDTCWDVGAGTGSVSVELAMRCPRGQVYALERDPQALALLDANRRRFCCDNILPVPGPAQETLSALPPPDCLFLGGSGGALAPILQGAFAKNPRLRLALTAVSLETLQQAQSVLGALGIEPEITQLAVTRTKKAGSHTMLTAENPIFLLRGQRP